MFDFAWNAQAVDGPAKFISQPKRRAVREAALAACGEQDGVKDVFIKDPLRCHFDPSVIACKGEDLDNWFDARTDRSFEENLCGSA
jgi:feruloyl esterase